VKRVLICITGLFFYFAIFHVAPLSANTAWEDRLQQRHSLRARRTEQPVVRTARQHVVEAEQPAVRTARQHVVTTEQPAVRTVRHEQPSARQHAVATGQPVARPVQQYIVEVESTAPALLAQPQQAQRATIVGTRPAERVEQPAVRAAVRQHVVEVETTTPAMLAQPRQEQHAPIVGTRPAQAEISDELARAMGGRIQATEVPTIVSTARQTPAAAQTQHQQAQQQLQQQHEASGRIISEYMHDPRASFATFRGDITAPERPEDIHVYTTPDGSGILIFNVATGDAVSSTVSRVQTPPQRPATDVEFVRPTVVREGDFDAAAFLHGLTQ